VALIGAGGIGFDVAKHEGRGGQAGQHDANQPEAQREEASSHQQGLAQRRALAGVSHDARPSRAGSGPAQAVIGERISNRRT
jgi:hypothetical protein